MTGWGEAAFDAYPPADAVLGHADIAVACVLRFVGDNQRQLDTAARLKRALGW